MFSNLPEKKLEEDDEKVAKELDEYISSALTPEDLESVLKKKETKDLNKSDFLTKQRAKDSNGFQNSMLKDFYSGALPKINISKKEKQARHMD